MGTAPPPVQETARKLFRSKIQGLKRKVYDGTELLLGDIHKGRPENPDKTVRGGGRGVRGVRTSEIEKIIFALFSSFLL